MRFLRRLPLFTLAIALLVTSSVAFAAPKQKPDGKGAEAGAGEKDKPFQDWKKITKDTETMTGFFTLYQKRENLYLEIKPEQLNQPVLGIFSLSRGIGRDFLLGGLPLKDRLIEFHRAGDRVLVMQKNTRFVAPSGSAYEKAKDLSHGQSVLASLKIESIHDSSKALLVDLAPFLVSDIGDLGEWMRDAFNNKPVRFDKERSTLDKVKVFPENVEIEALLTYSPNDRQGLNLNTIPDDRYVPITVHYSFSKLPEKPMLPRFGDDRTGYFLTAVKDFSRDHQEHFWVRYAERWRLEKKDPTAALSEPVKPIVFHIDHTVPEKWRPYVKKGVEAWQKAFEAAGFKNAIVAKDPPTDDPNWDPEDVRYSSIRWITSSEPSFGAIGPSRVDPRTGEILDADILFEASIVQRRWKIYRDLVGPASEGLLGTSTINAWPSAIPMERRCEAQAGISAGATLAHLGMLVNGDLPPGSPIQEQFIGQMLVHTTLHEVGHTLGLRHNFRASTSTLCDKLHDRTWTDAHGVMSSVMDYATPNISFEREKQGSYYSDVPGDADVWMIRYGYSPSGAADVDADYAFASKIADESNLAGHEYSTDEDTYGPNALDPRTNIWDLGDDPLRFSKERAAFVSGLWKSEKIEERILGASGEYPVLRRAMDGLLEQYGIALNLAVKFVGGQYQSRNHRGQPDLKDPLRPVSAVRQREALDFIVARGFATGSFDVSPALLNRLAPDRWSHWGVNDAFGVSTGDRLDYNLNEKVVAIQTGLVNGLTSPRLLARLREAESRSSDAFRMSELFDRLTRGLWGEVGGLAAAWKSLEGPHTRRDAQRVYVDRLAAMVVSPTPGMPDDARALARLQLSRIDARCARTLASESPMGDYTRAHVMETRARIKRALEASRDADAPAGRGGTATH